MEIIANVGLVMLLLTGALVTGAPVGNTTFTGSAGVCESAQLEQEEISCILRSDRGKRAEYYDTVLIKHGFPGTSGKFSTIADCVHVVCILALILSPL